AHQSLPRVGGATFEADVGAPVRGRPRLSCLQGCAMHQKGSSRPATRPARSSGLVRRGSMILAAVLATATFAWGVPVASTARAVSTRAAGLGAAQPPAAVDFNGDGYADLALGSGYKDVGSAADAGGVDVLYGSSAGIQAGSPPGQAWTQDS